MKSLLSILLCALLAVSPAAAEKKPRSEKIREKLVAMETGAIVEVTQKDGLWRGRLGELGAESFEMQVSGKQQIEKRSFRYGDVTNVRDASKRGMSAGQGVLLGVLVGIGSILVIGIIAAAAAS